MLLTIISLTFQHVDLYPCSNGQPRKKHELSTRFFLEMQGACSFEIKQVGYMQFHYITAILNILNYVICSNVILSLYLATTSCIDQITVSKPSL